MANNRLYIGNKETKETFCFTKSSENTWRGLQQKDLDSFNAILTTDFIWNNLTELVLFSESDTAWFNYFFSGGDLPNKITIDQTFKCKECGFEN